MARIGVAAIAMLLLLVPVAVAASETGFYEVNGIEYYYATGALGTGHFTLGSDTTGADQEPFTGCSWAKLRPDNNKGRVQVLGTWYERPLIIDVSDFPEANQTPDSIAPDEAVPADASGLGQIWPATMTVSSLATIDVGNVPVMDPVSGAPNFTATWFVTPKGFRDDASGAIRDAAGQPFDVGDEPAGQTGAPEVHMRLTSSGSPQGPANWETAAPGDAFTYLSPEDGYVAMYPVVNERLSGTARLHAQASSMMPPGFNALQFTVYAPDGTFVDAFSLTPDATQSPSNDIEFPLDQWGAYYVVVEGKVNLARYEITVEQQTPESFAMDFWWDGVQPGYDGLQARQACNEELDGPVMAAYVAPRPDPTAFDWTFSVMTVAGALVSLVVLVTFILSAYNHVVARRAVRD